MGERLYYLDNMKGILIILVILGHAIQYSVPNYESTFAFRFIYSFHMPLFFFISGFLSNRGYYKQGVIKKGAVQLLLPFIVWIFLEQFLKSGQLEINKSLDAIIYPDKGLWFLYNLFIYSLLFTFIDWLNKEKNINEWLLIIVAYIMLAGLMLIFHTKFNCTQLCYHYVFFSFGYIYKQIPKTTNIRHIVLGGLIYAFTVPFWKTSGTPLFYEYLNLGGIFSYFYRYFVQVLGMLVFFEIGCRYLTSKIRFITEYGMLTLGVYALQFSVLHHLNIFIQISSLLIKVIIETLLTVAICYLLVKVIKKIPYVRIFLIGEV